MSPKSGVPPRIRIDRLLVERGLAPSREKAQAFILAGLVTAAGRRVDKAGALIAPSEVIEVAPTARFVGQSARSDSTSSRSTRWTWAPRRGDSPIVSCSGARGP